MNRIEEFRQSYTEPGLRLLVECRGDRCRFELIGESGSEPPPKRLTLLALLQPRNARGLPWGPVVTVGKLAVPIRPLRDGRRYTGRGWLPKGITARLARQCHFRIDRDRIEEN